MVSKDICYEGSTLLHDRVAHESQNLIDAGQEGGASRITSLPCKRLQGSRDLLQGNCEIMEKAAPNIESGSELNL